MVASPGGKTVVEGMAGELDQPVAEAAGPGALVAHPGGGAERGQGDPQDGPAHGVEQARMATRPSSQRSNSSRRDSTALTCSASTAAAAAA